MLELFAGTAGLSQAVKVVNEKTVRVLDPVDEIFGANLLDDSNFCAVVEAAEKEKCGWIHMAPPCRTFSRARRKDKYGSVPVLRTDDKPEGFGCQDTTEANILADRCASIGEAQAKAGRFFSIENPEGSFIWMMKSFGRLAKMEGVSLVVIDQCAFGSEFKKPTGVLTNSPWIVKRARRCEDLPPHKHTPLVGRIWSYKVNKEVWRTSEAAEYPHGLCNEWALGLKEWLARSERPVEENVVVSDDEEPPVVEATKPLVRVGTKGNCLVRNDLVR